MNQLSLDTCTPGYIDISNKTGIFEALVRSGEELAKEGRKAGTFTFIPKEGDPLVIPILPIFKESWETINEICLAYRGQGIPEMYFPTMPIDVWITYKAGCPERVFSAFEIESAEEAFKKAEQKVIYSTPFELKSSGARGSDYTKPPKS